MKLFALKDQSKKPKYREATDAEIMMEALRIMRSHSRLSEMAEKIDMALLLGKINLEPVKIIEEHS